MRMNLLAELKKYDSLMFISPVVPADMRVSVADEDGWYEWEAIPSKLSCEDVKEIEETIVFTLAQEYKEFILTYHFLDLDFGEFILIGNPSDNKKNIQDFMMNMDMSKILISNEMIPIGSGSDGYSYLALNSKGNILQVYENDEHELESIYLSNSFLEWLNNQLDLCIKQI